VIRNRRSFIGDPADEDSRTPWGAMMRAMLHPGTNS